MIMRKGSAMAELPFHHPLITYENGRIATLEQFALEQQSLLEPPKKLTTKKTLRFKVSIVKPLVFEVKF